MISPTASISSVSYLVAFHRLFRPMPVPDLEIRGAVSKIFFRPFGPQFGLKIREGGGAGPPGPLPWIRHCPPINGHNIKTIID